MATAVAGGWRTLETEHFRLHHPVEATAYAEMAVTHLEEARQRTEEVVGRTEDRIVDVYIRDPYATANGMALSFRRRPKMVLWATPPSSSSQLANYRDVVEDLVVHEDLHLVHLLTPPRGGLRALVWSTVGIGPVASASPNWLAEGYATMVEGQLTGAGRPNADFRAAFLRVMAQEGRLPSYGQLNGSSRWNGGGFPYLVGSAYLEWLVARTDDEAMQRLWRRMAARETRSFDENFAGVFGDDPAALYQRYCAEITVEALAVETSTERHPFLELTGWTGAPAVSPVGDKLALMVQTDDPRRRSLRVVSTVADEVAGDRLAKEREATLRKDPQDVESVIPPRPRYEVLHERVNDLRPASRPRWISNDQLVFEALVQSSRERRVTDLFTWDLTTGRERRLTHDAGLRAADPAPRGGWAVAVQVDWGATRLVRVDLESGAVEPLTPYAVDRVVDAPRVSPDGSRIVFMEQTRGTPFRPVVLQLSSGEREVLGQPGVRLADPEWSGPERLVFGVGRGGALEVAALDLPTGEWTTLTSTDGLALHPTLSDDHLYHLRLHADGYAVDRVAIEAVRDPELGGRPPIATPPLPSEVPPPTGSGTVPPSTRYGIGGMEFLPLLGGGHTQGERQVEAGFRVGDAMGRLEGVVLGSYGGNKGVTGFGTTWAVRRAVEVQLHASATTKATTLRLAGGATVEDRYRRGGWVLGWRLGGHAVTLADAVAPVSTATLRVGVVSRNASASLGLTGRALQGVAEGGFAQELEPRLVLGRGRLAGSWRVGRRGSTWPARLGGLPSGLVHPDLQWGFIGGPGWGAATALSGTTRFEDRRVQLGEALGLRVQNVRLNSQDERLEGTMVAGVLNLWLPADSLIRLPEIGVQAGVGCVVNPLTGTRDRQPCRELSDGALWGSLRMGL